MKNNINKITIAKDSTMRIEGSLAHKFYWTHKNILKLAHDGIDSESIAFVYELDGTMRAGQRSEENAMEYMNVNRISIVKE
jgi:hypothetical protein